MDYSYFNQGFDASSYAIPTMDPTISNSSLPNPYGVSDLHVNRSAAAPVASAQPYMYNSMRSFPSAPTLPASTCTMGMMARQPDPRQTHMFAPSTPKPSHSVLNRALNFFR